MLFLKWVANILFWTFFFVSSSIYIVIACCIRILTAPFDKNLKILQQFSCFWASNYIWVNPFWSVTISGKENVDRSKVYVMVANHQSIVDILVLFRTFLHFKWVSKAEIFKLPLLGWNMRLNGYVGIKRGDPESREKCLEHCRWWLKRGSSVFFFPEGTRSVDGKMKDFKIGAFRLALEAGVDILPMLISGSRNAVPKKSLFLSRHSDMNLKILPPISIANFDREKIVEEAERLAKETHDRIERG